MHLTIVQNYFTYLVTLSTSIGQFNYRTSYFIEKNITYFDVGFSYCWINREVLKYSLEQYIGFVGRLAFIHYCGLHQVWLEAEN